WDGYVRSYYNLDIDGNGRVDDIGVDGYLIFPPDFREQLDTPGTYVNPGDIATMTSKYGITGDEAIDGYKVWTVPADTPQKKYAEEDWLSPTLLPEIHLVSTLIRDNSSNPPSGFSYDVLYTKPAGYTRPQLDV